MKTRRILIIASLVVSLAVLSLAVFGKRGVFALVSLNARKDKLTEEIGRLTKENNSLSVELNRLKRPDYQEQFIRSRMGMAREGEIIYIFTKE
jgi:cell division protein FtsB